MNIASTLLVLKVSKLKIIRISNTEMEETVIQKILSESYNVCNLQWVKLLIKKGFEKLRK